MTAARWIDIDGPSPAHFVDCTPAEYYRPSGPPRLSQSIAKELCERSPWHAKRALDRQEQADEDDGARDDDKATKERDRGTIVHALLLGTPSPAVIVADPTTREPFRDFKTKAAQQQRDAVRAAGKIPVIAHKIEPTLRLADRLRDELYNEHGIDLNGRSEAVVHWTERASDGTPVPCRGMLDHWIESRRVVYDLKIWASANPKILSRKLPDYGCDIQGEAYTRAIEAVHPNLAGRVRFVTLVCEVHSGLVVPVIFGGGMRTLGRMRWQRAIDLWARCARLDDWPGYTRGEMVIDAPEYALAAEMAQRHDVSDLRAIADDMRRPMVTFTESEQEDEEDGYERADANV